MTVDITNCEDFTTYPIHTTVSLPIVAMDDVTQQRLSAIAHIEFNHMHITLATEFVLHLYGLS